ncbi:MAG: bifunctional hydroxymethylpyrimidine kinase/phosphomethylpyrimidine kinase [Kiritimatiellae bacterium]|nr:bifunctional hydroxymethylpyrimidine kinase/phosphomethylpyrimidine kinase [Kiritimatiellia bacterium]
MAGKVVLTIAGSDSGGGAGIQADMEVFLSLELSGTTAITCVTAQNPSEVTGVEPISPDMVSLQIKTVCRHFPIAAAKTGMLYSAEIIRAVAKAVRKYEISTLVVDPVMVATSGARLLKDDAISALCTELLPYSTVITPNIAEAEVLCGHDICSTEEMRSAANEIAERFDTACVIKGGHLAISDTNAEESMDILSSEGNISMFTLPKIEGVDLHGSGCRFSAAITGHLARGVKLAEATGLAKEYVHSALTQQRR